MEPHEIDAVLALVEPSLKPYRDKVESYRRLPPVGRDRDDVLREVRELAAAEEDTWRSGGASGAVYHGDPDHIEFLNAVYAATSQVNPLHPDLWPSGAKYEAEIVAMTASMLGGGEGGVETVCGVVTSGGTESILLAMKAYRDWGRSERGVERPVIVAPTTAHVAFDKAAHYFGMDLVRVPVGSDFRADVDATAAALSDETVVVVGSAPQFPHGVVDPIGELSELARSRGIGFHTDACLGGFILPWAEKLGYPVPPFDFRLPGVTSISADTHKFGYAAKGTSVVLFRDRALRRHAYFTSAEWPGGLYFSATLAGSRPGALSAECWAAMVAMGEQGYREATRAVLETAARVREGIDAIPELTVLGDPLWVIAFASDSDDVDIYAVNDQMLARGWHLNPLQLPPALHLCVTLRHTQPGVAERFLTDLRESVTAVAARPGAGGSMTPIYGMAAAVETRGTVHELVARYVDLLYEV